jgi:hypothetical protein
MLSYTEKGTEQVQCIGRPLPHQGAIGKETADLTAFSPTSVCLALLKVA